jgi:pyridoxine 4-dehydrogenase
MVNRMGFGARWVTAGGSAGPDLLRRAVELGVNLIDTADVYDMGRSEELIAEALHPYPDDLVIATKGGQISRDGKPAADGSPAHLRSACEDSLRRLRLDTIPLYQLHMPDPDVSIEESIGALAELRDEGKVAAIGVSNFFGPLIDRAESSAAVVSVQNRFNLQDRASDTEVDRCAAAGRAFLPWAPLAGLAEVPADAPVSRIAAARAAAPSQVALAWMLARSPAMVVIPGTRSIEHLEQNVAAASIELSADELAQLEAPTPV